MSDFHHKFYWDDYTWSVDGTPDPCGLSNCELLRRYYESILSVTRESVITDTDGEGGYYVVGRFHYAGLEREILFRMKTGEASPPWEPDLSAPYYERLADEAVEDEMENKALKIERPRRYAIFKSAPEYKPDEDIGDLPF